MDAIAKCICSQAMAFCKSMNSQISKFVNLSISKFRESLKATSAFSLS